MDREKAYLRILSSTADIQSNISLILEAKAEEAEKMRYWICNHIQSNSFNNYESQLIQSLQLHNQIVEIIDGITKLNHGMVSILKVILPREEQEAGFGYLNGTNGNSSSYGDQ
ncbi:restriction endonuclease subunit S [Paenibacillus sp. sgz302251]|uniref:restriction endonuclease subunit S n=1 Tax=Paenibacillus sp. sgz302251 TaxID=3414493 RepID=UPI003C7BC155